MLFLEDYILFLEDCCFINSEKYIKFTVSAA